MSGGGETVNWEAIGAIGEVVGAAGVIASLLYLAVQIRGDARAKRATTVHQQSEAFRSFLKMIATDDELGSIYLRGLRDFESLDESASVRKVAPGTEAHTGGRIEPIPANLRTNPDVGTILVVRTES